MFVFRPLTVADRPAMLDICATVWDGDDYLPKYFDHWVQAAGGQFTGAEFEGRLVAVAKLTRCAPGEYWLEGIRVHSAFRQRGLAAALHDYHLALWRAWQEPGALRLLTENPAIQKLCERTGFRARFQYITADAPAVAQPHHFTVLTLADLDRAYAYLTDSVTYADWHGLCDMGWKWRELTPALLAQRITAGAVYGWGQWDGVLVTIQTQHDDVAPSRHLGLQFPATTPAQWWAMLSETRALAHHLGQADVRWSALLKFHPHVAQAGFALRWEGTPETCYEVRQ